jgi:uncharacterized protein (TIGR02598 family)
MKKRPTTWTQGYTLVEVVFALGVAVFCLLPVLGLLPIGLLTNQGTVRETMATSLAQAVADDLRATPPTSMTSPVYNLGVPATGGSVAVTTFYLTENGTAAPAPSTQSPTYLATVVFTPAVAGTLNASSARILITWPALPNQPNNQVPSHYQGSFETVVGLSRN